MLHHLPENSTLGQTVLPETGYTKRVPNLSAAVQSMYSHPRVEPLAENKCQQTFPSASKCLLATCRYVRKCLIHQSTVCLVHHISVRSSYRTYPQT